MLFCVHVRIVPSMLVCVTVCKQGYIYVIVHVLELYDVKNLMS